MLRKAGLALFTKSRLRKNELCSQVLSLLLKTFFPKAQFQGVNILMNFIRHFDRFIQMLKFNFYEPSNILILILLDFGRNDVFMKSFRFLLTFNNPSLEVLQQHAGLLHFALQLLDGIIHNRLLSQFWST